MKERERPDNYRWARSGFQRAVGSALAVLLSGAIAGSAQAHGGAGLAAGEVWSAWRLTPEISLASLLAAGIYVAGARRSGGPEGALRMWRHVAFFLGLAAIFLALQSPIDPVAERLFLMHQIQHLLLRMVGPMLIALAAPQAALIAGLPDGLRRGLLGPIARSGAVRGVFAFLADPWVATALFVAALYVWQVPRYHDAALLDDALHYAMHASMLLTGLIFWWVVFDARPAPKGLRYGRRLMMLWIGVLANILIGSYLTFKSAPLYEAYDQLGRLWGFSALADEQLGGVTLWIPGSMMFVLAVLFVIHLWGRHEERLETRKASFAEGPAAGGAVAQGSARGLVVQPPRNRALALGLALFVGAIFFSAIAIGIVSNLLGS